MLFGAETFNIAHSLNDSQKTTWRNTKPDCDKLIDSFRENNFNEMRMKPEWIARQWGNKFP